jgi:hypothetical protein
MYLPALAWQLRGRGSYIEPHAAAVKLPITWQELLDIFEKVLLFHDVAVQRIVKDPVRYGE